MAPGTQPVRHTWSEDDRILLCLLCRFYENQKSSLFQIWNAINRTTLLLEGFIDGTIANTALHGQGAEMKRTGHRVYNSVMNATLSELRQQYTPQKNIIEETAQALGITLKLRVEPPSVPQQPQVESMISQAEPYTREDWSPSTVPSAEPSKPIAFKKHDMNLDRQLIKQFVYQPLARGIDDPVDAVYMPAPPMEDYSIAALVAAGCELPSTQPKLEVVVPSLPQVINEDSPYKTNRDQYGRYIRSPPLMYSQYDSVGTGNTRRHPTMLFRAFEPAHNFKARRFVSAPVTTPPAFLSDDFRTEVEPHLNKDETFLSPFISTTESSHNALRLAKRSSGTRGFAVFHYDEVYSMRSKKNSAGPWLVPTICKKHLLELPGGYRGRGELLIWGAIEVKPLLILDAEEASKLYDLLESMRGHPHLGYAAGGAIFPYIAGIEEDKRETLLRFLSKNFYLSVGEYDFESEEWLEFIDGAGCPLDPESLEVRSRTGSVLPVSLNAPDLTMIRERSGDSISSISTTMSSMADDEAVVKAAACHSEALWSAPAHTAVKDVDNADDTAPMEAAIDANETPANTQTAQQDYTAPDSLIDMLSEAARGSDSEISPSSTQVPSCATNRGPTPAPAFYRAPMVIDLTGSDAEGTPVEYHVPDDSDGDVINSIEQDTNNFEQHDIVMIDDDEGELVVVSEQRRALSIRSRPSTVAGGARGVSVVETPTRPSRYPSGHTSIL